MATNTKIEWCDATFNPWRGCSKISAGCAHCYADALSARNPAVLGTWGPGGTRVVAADSAWRDIERWCRTAPAKLGRRPRVFVASLADVFEGADTMPAASAPDVDRARVRLLALIASNPQVDWLLLTKRPQNVLEIISDIAAEAVLVEYRPAMWLAQQWLRGQPPPNVWLGTSIEDQAAANERIPHLLRVPAAVRFLSAEPLLEMVNIAAGLFTQPPGGQPDESPEAGGLWSGPRSLGKDGINWVICGGESGPHARPMHPAWARLLRDQCAAAGVPFFFKQWGEWAPVPLCDRMPGHVFKQGPAFDGMVWRIGKARAGNLLDGAQHLAFPTPTTPAPQGAA